MPSPYQVPIALFVSVLALIVMVLLLTRRKK
jgi:ABC-type enterochelin transport system permease subunit